VFSRRSHWKALGGSVIAATSLAVASLSPAVASSAQSGTLSRVAAGHSQKPAAATRCKVRNKSVGTVKFSDWQFPDTLNEYQTQASVSQEVISTIHDDLTTYNGNGGTVPILLTRLPTLKNGQVTNGGRTIAATLRQGLRWSNGQALTAADVKFGWQVGMDPKSGPYCAGTCDHIARIDVKGKYGLVFHLKSVYAPFVPVGLPQVWPTSWPGGWAKGDVSAAVTKLFTDSSFNMEGSAFPTNGPYMVTQFVKDDRIVLKPMKYYNSLACGARVGTLIFAFYSDKNAAIAAATQKNTDITTDYTWADLTNLQGHAGAYKVHAIPAFEFEHLTFNMDPTYNGQKNPLHDVRVRLALSLALNKIALIRSALGLGAAKANEIVSWSPFIITPTFKQPFADTALKGQWDPISKTFRTDTGSAGAIADAKKLLSQAGYSGGFSLDGYTTSGNAVRAGQFSVIQSYWKKVNVNFVPNFVPAGKLFGGWTDGGTLQHGAFQVAMYADVGSPDPDNLKVIFQSKYIDREKTAHSSTNQNEPGLKDKIVDQGFDKGAASFDPKVRLKYYTQVQIELNKVAPFDNLFYRPEIATEDGQVNHFVTNPTNTGNQWNTWQWTAKGQQ
jgi:peptide/nickel transport system substrate-binding protein